MLVEEVLKPQFLRHLERESLLPALAYSGDRKIAKLVLDWRTHHRARLAPAYYFGSVGLNGLFVERPFS